MKETSIELVILNQYYVPDVASTGHLLYELATESASRNVAVKVVTSFPSYGPPESWQPCPGREIQEGVRVHRLRTTRFSKDRIFGRLMNSLTFLIPLFFRQLLAGSKNRVFLYTTNPPFLGIIGALVSLLRPHRYVVLLHDSYPHMAVWCGKIQPNGLIERIWHMGNRLIYLRASQTIVLCVRAKELVCKKYGVDPSCVHVVHNWADPKALIPLNKADSNFAKKHGFDQVFTLLYSGNLGLYYEFESLLQAADRLRSDPSIQFVFVGAGGKRQWLANEIKSRNLTNTTLFPYQPFEALNDSLNACDASLVTISKGIEGISFPSKLYSSLAVGKPVIAISEDGSELKEMVEGSGSGIWIPLGDVDALVNAIQRLQGDAKLKETMGKAARVTMENHYTIRTATDEYLRIIRLASGEAN